MIKLVKIEDYSSEEEYQEAYQKIIELIKIHNEDHSIQEFDPNYRENFLKSLSELREKAKKINIFP